MSRSFYKGLFYNKIFHKHYKFKKKFKYSINMISKDISNELNQTPNSTFILNRNSGLSRFLYKNIVKVKGKNKLLFNTTKFNV